MKPKLLVGSLLLCFCAMAQSDPWPETALQAPAKLAAQITDKSAPTIIYVGFPVLYKGAHIANAIFAGPCSKATGLDLLTQSVKVLKPDAPILIYCGCCPFTKCPNVHPAFDALKKAGFTNVKVLDLETSLHTDWVEKGYPTEPK